MQPDPTRIQDTKGWLAKAQDDLRACEVLLDAQPPLIEDVVFHAQQAAEKVPKGVLTWHDRPFRKTHDLAELGQQCIDIDPSLEEPCRHAESLTIFAWIFRYPQSPPPPPAEEARGSLALARELYENMLDRLQDEAQA